MQTHRTQIVRSNSTLSFTTVLPSDLPRDLVEIVIEQFLVEVQCPSPRVPFPMCYEGQQYRVIPLTNGREFKLQVSRNVRVKDGSTQTSTNVISNRKRKRGILHTEEMREYVEELRVKYGLSKEDVDDILENGPLPKTTGPSRTGPSDVPHNDTEFPVECPIATSTQHPPISIAADKLNPGTSNNVDEGEIDLGGRRCSQVSLESVLRRAGINKENLADLTCSSIEESPPESANSQPPPPEIANETNQPSSPESPTELRPPEEEEVPNGPPNELENQSEKSHDLPVVLTEMAEKQPDSEKMETQESEDSMLNLEVLASEVLMSMEDEGDENRDPLSETQEADLLSVTIGPTEDAEPSSSPCSDVEGLTPNHQQKESNNALNNEDTDGENSREKIDVVLVPSQPENSDLVVEKSPKLDIKNATKPMEPPEQEIIEVFSQTQQHDDVPSQTENQDTETNSELVFIDSQESPEAEVIVIEDTLPSPEITNTQDLISESQKSSEDVFATPETSPVLRFETPEAEDTLDHVMESVGLERVNKQVEDEFVPIPKAIVSASQIVTTQSLPSPERPIIPAKKNRKKKKKKIPYDMDLASRQLLAIPETRHGLRKRQENGTESNDVALSARKKKRVRL